MENILSTLNESLPTSALVLNLVLLLILFRKLSKRSIIRPVILVPIFLIAYQIIGTFNLLVIQAVVGWYEGIQILRANRITFISSLLLLVVIIFGSVEVAIRKRGRLFNRASLLRWIVLGTVVGTLLNIPNFLNIGGLPIFWSNLTGSERFDLAERMWFSKFLIINSSLLTLNIIYFANSKKFNLVNAVCFVVNLTIAASIGSRHLVFLPLLIGGVQLLFTKKVSSKIVIGIFILCAILIVLFGILRGDPFDPEVSSGLVAFGGEYRDFLLLKEYFLFTDYYYGATLVPVVTNAIPKQVFSAVNLKKDDFAIYSAYVAQDVWGAQTGIRTGIWGELFMNWGDFGIVIGFALFGLFLAKLDKWLQIYQSSEPNMLLLSLVYTLALFSVVGSWATIGDTLEVYGVLYLAFAKLIKHS